MSDKDGGEADNKDEAIVPTDMNLICDDDLRLVLKPLKEGVKFTMVRPPHLQYSISVEGCLYTVLHVHCVQ